MQIYVLLLMILACVCVHVMHVLLGNSNHILLLNCAIHHKNSVWHATIKHNDKKLPDPFRADHGNNMIGQYPVHQILPTQLMKSCHLCICTTHRGTNWYLQTVKLFKTTPPCLGGIIYTYYGSLWDDSWFHSYQLLTKASFAIHFHTAEIPLHLIKELNKSIASAIFNHYKYFQVCTMTIETQMVYSYSDIGDQICKNQPCGCSKTSPLFIFALP